MGPDARFRANWGFVDSGGHPPHDEPMHFRSLLLALGLVASIVQAGPVPETNTSIKDGKELIKAMQLAIRACDNEKLANDDERARASYARGYLKGLIEASWVLDYANDQVPYILPTNITDEQLAKVILHYLSTHQDKRDKASYEIVALALTEAFRNPKWEPLPSTAPKHPRPAGDD